MKRYRRTLASLAVVAFLAIMAMAIPPAGPALLGVTIVGVVAAAHQEHIHVR